MFSAPRYWDATTNSGVSVTLAVIEFAMKQWFSTPAMALQGFAKGAYSAAIPHDPWRQHTAA